MSTIDEKSQLQTATARVQQVADHLRILPPPETFFSTPPTILPLSLIHGPKDQKLIAQSLGQALDDIAKLYPDNDALVCYSQGTRLAYATLRQRSRRLASQLLKVLDLQAGDRVGIFAGNESAYIELFFATARIGLILVVLNPTYTRSELVYALKHTECKALFISPQIGRNNNERLIRSLQPSMSAVEAKLVPSLRHLVLLGGAPAELNSGALHYDNLFSPERLSQNLEAGLDAAEAKVRPDDVCNLQFTSGTTGSPKAAMLTHFGLLNNGHFIGSRMKLTSADRVCCPPPLFHCFGLVLGLLSAITHGSAFVIPCDVYNPEVTIEAAFQERCTVLHGVPTMFSAQLQAARKEGKIEWNGLRTGIAAGSPVPRQLMEDVRSVFNLNSLLNVYGMTETSPASFMTSLHDPVEKRLSTVGTLLPHTSAKIIDPNGDIVPLGSRGELCVSGYLLQKGYWNNSSKTAEVMIRDEAGVIWMHTGDEAQLDCEGYCKITGRIKDIIIRGGENIFPLEIEERLMQHPAVHQASVIGVKDNKYGEEVAAFLHLQPNKPKPDLESLKSWVGQTLARHKRPRYVYWVGDENVGDTLPQTGSGKIKKNVLREIGDRLVASGAGQV